MIRRCGVFVWLVIVSISHGHSDNLQIALGRNLPRPDLVLTALDSPSAEHRQWAAEGISRWHEHIPGAVDCLRRLAHDEDEHVVTAAIVAASRIGSRDAFIAIADAVSRKIDPDHIATIADAMDTRAFRLFWMRSDEFGLRDKIESLIDRRSQPHDETELTGLVFPAPTRSIIESGRAVFQSTGCVGCHQVNGYGRDAFALTLRGIGLCYDNATLVRHLVEPSLDIHDAGRQERFVIANGQVWLGREVHTGETPSNEHRIVIQTDPARPDELVSINREDLAYRDWSNLSPMPVGLLDRCTPTQIADLVVYLRTDGGLVAMPSDSHDHH